MKAARLVVLGVALAAGGDRRHAGERQSRRPKPPKAPPPPPPLATVEVLVAKTDLGRGQVVGEGDVGWQTWPAARPTRASSKRPTGRTRSKISSAPSCACRSRRASRSATQGRLRQGLRLHGRDPAAGHARGIDGRFAGNRRRRLHPAQRPCRRRADAARQGGGKDHRRREIHQRHDPAQCAGARDRSGGRGKGRPEGRGRQDRDARARSAAGRDARAGASARHAVAGVAQPARLAIVDVGRRRRRRQDAARSIRCASA